MGAATGAVSMLEMPLKAMGVFGPAAGRATGGVLTLEIVLKPNGFFVATTGAAAAAGRATTAGFFVTTAWTAATGIVSTLVMPLNEKISGVWSSSSSWCSVDSAARRVAFCCRSRA